MTPIEWTRGRLLATAASLLVNFSAQILKWHEPASAAAETIHRLLRFCARPQKVFSSFGNTLQRTSTNQHAVPVAIKSIVGLHRMVVSGEHVFAACECADQR